MLSSPLAIRADDEQQRIVQNYLRQLGASDEINILEAGCGRYWPFDLQGARFKLTGIDADKHALEHRKNAEKDLDDAILADLRSLDLPSNTYDVIYNAFMLEHIDGAEQVLQKFLNWLKPNGSLIVYIPDRYSAYGFFAHHTPHWLHVFFYRYILGSKNAGKPGFAPTQRSTTRSSLAKEFANSLATTSYGSRGVRILYSTISRRAVNADHQLPLVRTPRRRPLQSALHSCKASERH